MQRPTSSTQPIEGQYLSHHANRSEPRLRINVGGEVIVCFRRLLNTPGSLIEEVLASNHWITEPPKKGYPYFDRNPNRVRKLLEHLRDGTPITKLELQKEAEFWRVFPSSVVAPSPAMFPEPVPSSPVLVPPPHLASPANVPTPAVYLSAPVPVVTTPRLPRIECALLPIVPHLSDQAARLFDLLVERNKASMTVVRSTSREADCVLYFDEIGERAQNRANQEVILQRFRAQQPG